MRIPVGAVDMAGAATAEEDMRVVAVRRAEGMSAVDMSGEARQAAVTLAETVEDVLAVRLEVAGMSVEGIRDSVPLR